MRYLNADHALHRRAERDGQGWSLQGVAAVFDWPCGGQDLQSVLEDFYLVGLCCVVCDNAWLE